MNKRIITSLYRKEITDILRDKKTMLMMIVVPLILYPLLFMGSLMFVSKMANASTEKSYTVALDGVNDPVAMKAIFKDKGAERDYSFEFVEPDGDMTDASMLEEGKIDVYITESVSDNRPYYSINYLASETDSRTAAGMAENMLSDYRTDLTSIKLKDLSLSEDEILKPVQYAYKDHSSNEENIGYLMGMIIPFLMIVSVLMGAMYPAIDTTAGEKERGTLETMLTLPVSNKELITAKFMAVSTIAVASALLNLLSMGFVTVYVADSMKLAGTAQISGLKFVPSLLITLLCVVSFAMFTSAVSLCVCIRAGSFKEAQNISTPLMLIFMMGGMAAMIPDMKLDNVTSLIPVVNISMLISSLFKFDFDPGLILMVLLSNVAYSALAVIIMAEVFAAEDVLFSDPSSSIRVLNRRSDMKKGAMPGIGDLILLFAVLLLVVLFAGSTAVLRYGVYGLMIEQTLIFALPVLYAWYIKADMKKLFSLKIPKISSLLGGFIAYVGLWLITMVVQAYLVDWFPSIGQSQEGLINLWEGKSLLIMAVSSAVFPGICEEVAFRGFMLGTLKNKYSPVKAVLITGILFGAYHMNILQFVGAGLLGILFSYIVWKGESIYVTMFLHILNNFVVVYMTYNADLINERFPELLSGVPSPAQTIAMLAGGAVLMTLGVLMLRGRKRKA